MPETEPVAEWLERWRNGDAQAAERLFTRYARRLTGLAEQHLSCKLAGRLDGEDVVQSVFRTFFRRSAAGEFRIDSSAQLWRLLVKITLLKAQAKGRHHTADKRNVTAEVPGSDAWLAQALASDPGPAEAAALVDQIEALLHGLPALYGSVLDLRLQGHDVPAIAAQLGYSTRTIQRALNLLQHRLTRSADDPR
jgi:RNA polymerase sigma-70 factor, ECF subfamily